MTQFLPDNLLSLFAPRPPLEYKQPPDDLVVNRKRAPIQGIAQYVSLFEVCALDKCNSHYSKMLFRFI